MRIPRPVLFEQSVIPENVEMFQITAGGHWPVGVVFLVRHVILQLINVSVLPKRAVRLDNVEMFQMAAGGHWIAGVVLLGYV